MKALKVLSIGLVCSAMTGCATNDLKPYEPEATKGRTVFLPSYRTNAPEPVYARTRWVHPPQVLPPRSKERDTRSSEISTPSIRPVYELDLQDSTLDQTCKVLASMARYSSYTSPSLASRVYSFKSLGTIDELAEMIENKAGIKVSVDHESREVRFLVQTAPEPTLSSEKVE